MDLPSCLARLRYAKERIHRMIRPRVTVTPPPPGVRFERDVPVAMRDGTILRVNVFRPESDGPCPVILCAHPYGKDDLPKPDGKGGHKVPLRFHLFRQPEPFAFSAWTSWEAPDPAFWVPRGYCVVNCDLRGFGTSDGQGTLLSHAESLDYFDLIQWAASQPWSTGKVGLLGVSYLALSQYRVAQLNPPGLAAICPWEGFSDLYRDLAYPGGVREDGFMKLWSRQVLKAGRTTDNPRQAQLDHPLRDAWWQEHAPDLESINVPMLVCASFSDHCLHSGGSLRAFQRASSAHKWLYTHRGGKWSTFYGEEARKAQTAFFGQFLKGEDTGILDTPPVRLEVRESGNAVREVRQEPSWPLPGTVWTPLHLDDSGSLSAAIPSRRTGLTLDLPSGRAVFEHVFDQDTELTGSMNLRLHLELEGAKDCCLFAGVYKLSGRRTVGFEGSYGFGLDRVATGWLRASHREGGVVSTLPGASEPAHTRAQPLAPGVVVPLDIALLPSATFFRKGEGMRLVVQGRWFEPRNPLFGQFPAGYEASTPCRARLHFGEGCDSALTVPVIPPRG
ncbi:Cocaine esterase [Fundidesulfovibrio magnetotacticus]|uniref:Cocaine esterase n=1 Tax=Fundidesulfovibrio magnetotacticus TaxID=2730080 RepID=A0A6V8M0U0_9BACT|nr:CocE/NonD family hydrolase [Fundidesulfovibrio magnetotacticus]GFK95626.1 Cocaine esterase [Fundidesulfovibrio magnetotacticus]